MSLTLWLFFDPPNPPRARLVPAEFVRLTGDDGAVWERGPVLESPVLSNALAVARPVGPHAAGVAEAWHAPARVTLSLAPRGDAGAESPAIDSLDDLGMLSLFAEYCEALRAALAALEAPLLAIVPGAGELGLELGAWPAAGPDLWRERFLLLWGAADWLARARGFRIVSARVRIGEQRWHDLATSPWTRADVVAGRAGGRS